MFFIINQGKVHIISRNLGFERFFHTCPFSCLKRISPPDFIVKRAVSLCPYPASVIVNVKVSVIVKVKVRVNVRILPFFVPDALAATCGGAVKAIFIFLREYLVANLIVEGHVEKRSAHGEANRKCLRCDICLFHHNNLLFDYLLFTVYLLFSHLAIRPFSLPYGRVGVGLLLKNLLSVHDVDALLNLVDALTCNIVDSFVIVKVNVNVFNACRVVVIVEEETLHRI